MNADKRRWTLGCLSAFICVYLRLILPLPLSAADSTDAVKQAAQALADRDAAAFMAVFDPSMPGMARIKADVNNLLRAADVQSNLTFSDGAVTWTLRIADYEGSAVTRREARIAYRVERGKIVRFEPAGFFRPADVDGAWNTLESAGAGLANGSSVEFLSYFDKSTPGYQKLANDAATVVTRGEVQSSIDVVANEGTDTTRTIEADWTLQLVNEDSGLQLKTRAQRVKIRLETRGKRWLITAFDPADFFAPLLSTPEGHNGGALLNR